MILKFIIYLYFNTNVVEGGCLLCSLDAAASHSKGSILFHQCVLESWPQINQILNKKLQFMNPVQSLITYKIND